MTRLPMIKGQGRATVVVCVVALLLMMLLSACGDGSGSSDMGLDGSSSEPTETGSAVFTIQWHNAPTVKGLVTTLAEEPMNCENAGVEWITCRVYDESNDHLITGDRWPCSAHSGRIDGIPVGHSRKFVILGEDADGNILFQGQKQDIVIDARPDNDAGTIEANPFVPGGLTATTVSASQIDLSWNAPNTNVSFAGYRIYRNGAEVGTSASLSHSDTGLTQDTEYCYTVSAYDAFDNESGLSNNDCAPTEVSEDKDPPTIPTGLNAQAMSSSQIDLSWITSTDNMGVTGYWIYRDGDQVGKSASPRYSDTGLTQNTEYCYTVEAYDAAGNPSGESDQDCDTTNESFDWFRDRDEDAYGDPNDSINSETQPENYVSDNTDCNDNDANIHPGATEICDGVDNNCSDTIDEGVTSTFYRDGDGDNFGDPENTTQGCSAPPGYVADNTDCDDGNAGINPDASEACDGIDNNCNETIDEGVTTTFYRDVDRDTFGNEADTTQACSAPPGYVATNGDCNDNDPLINPNAIETCNEKDDDCDGTIDNGIDCPQCYPELPSPNLMYDYAVLEDEFTRYYLIINNPDDFPDELFTPAPHLPPCGENTESSRTWVDIFDNNGNRLYGFCGFSSSSDLQSLWFAVPTDATPPESVYIEMIDRECEYRYISNDATIEDRHAITQIELDPDSPSQLISNQRVNITFNYLTTEPGGVRLFVFPFTNGALSPNPAVNPSPIYPMGSGIGDGFFTITSGSQTVDQVKFQMTNADQSEILLEFFMGVSYFFRPNIGLVVDEIVVD